MTIGKLLHIHTTAGTGRAMVSQEMAMAIPGMGIEGDRYAKSKGKFSRSPGCREVTLFEIETILRLEQEHGIRLLPQEHRRNLTTQGTALSRLCGQIFFIGDVTFEGLRPCQPCRYLNVTSKKQVSTRLADQAGLFCRVVSGGMLKPGDPIGLKL